MIRIGLKHPALLALEKKLELPMLLLSFIWMCVLIAELVYGVDPLLSGLGNGIWILFILYLSLRLVTVAEPAAFLKRNWLFVLAILVSMLRFIPFLQPFPVVRVLTATFGMQVVWIFVTANQGMLFLHRALGRRGTGYALAFSTVVIFAGAAGMLFFERGSDAPRAIHTYPDALWWTAMQMTNISTGYPIMTTGGRVLCLAISVYAAAMFGYLTALLATVFIDRAEKDMKPDILRAAAIADIKQEIVLLRRAVEEALDRPAKKP